MLSNATAQVIFAEDEDEPNSHFSYSQFSYDLEVEDIADCSPKKNFSKQKSSAQFSLNFNRYEESAQFSKAATNSKEFSNPSPDQGFDSFGQIANE